MHLLKQTLCQSLVVISGMSYISHRHRNYEIKKAVNQLQYQGCCLHIRQPLDSVQPKTFICPMKTYFKQLSLRQSQIVKETFIGATRCSIDTCKWLEYLLGFLGNYFIRLKHIKVFETVQKSNDKSSQKKLHNAAINLPSYIFRFQTQILLAFFSFISLLNF